MSRFKIGDLAVVTCGAYEGEETPTTYHYYKVGTVVQITEVLMHDRDDWGDQYVAAPTHADAWVDGHDRGDQFIFDTHLAPVDHVDLSPTTVENYLNGATEIVGGLIKTSQTPFFNPLNGNE